MGARKTHDLVVKTGSYTNGAGEVKGRYKNVGIMMENDDGGKFLMIDPSVNFAGFNRQEGKDMVIVSMFEPKTKDGQTASGGENWQE